jgi:hypothetical protein
LEGVVIVKKDGLKLLAKLLAAHCYRNNTPIEDIHAGRWPKNTKGQYAADSEVIVTTVDGGDKIPWTHCSRIHDSEMKELNKSVVNNIYSLLSLVEEFDALPSTMGEPHNWDEAKHARWYKTARRQILASLSSKSGPR